MPDLERYNVRLAETQHRLANPNGNLIAQYEETVGAPFFEVYFSKRPGEIYDITVRRSKQEVINDDQLFDDVRAFINMSVATDPEGNVTGLHGNRFQVFDHSHMYVATYHLDKTHPQQANLYEIVPIERPPGLEPALSAPAKSYLFDKTIYPPKVDWLRTFIMYIEGAEPNGLVINAKSINTYPLVPVKTS